MFGQDSSPLITYAIPFFMLLVGIEFIYGLIKRENNYRINANGKEDTKRTKEVQIGGWQFPQGDPKVFRHSLKAKRFSREARKGSTKKDLPGGSRR